MADPSLSRIGTSASRIISGAYTPDALSFTEKHCYRDFSREIKSLIECGESAKHESTMRLVTDTRTARKNTALSCGIGMARD